MKEKALFIGIKPAGNKNDHETESHLDELVSLARSLDIKTAGRITVPLKKPVPAFLTGEGKAAEIIDAAAEAEADMIIFDEELAPSQQRNWENKGNIRTIDRQEVILAIFERRAYTKEAGIQVELAKYRYLLPRLKRAWTHLSRQRGGVSGTRGEGEKQIEIDRRIALDRIAKLEKELEELKKHRDNTRKKRKNSGVFTCAIAGYTNSGKSTLLNTLTGAQTDANNRLFDTLDPSTRRLKLKGGREIVLTDTVGFIRKLPHQLFEAFKSTLEETTLADLIIILLDASSQEVLNHYKISMQVLSEIGAENNRKLVVFNKIDKCENLHELDFFKREHPDSVFISALEQLNIDTLLSGIEKAVSRENKKMNLFIPSADYRFLQLIKRNGSVISDKYTDEGVFLSAMVPEKIMKTLNQYSISNPE